MSGTPTRKPCIAIEIAPNPQFLSLLRRFAGCMARELNLSEEEALQLELCLDEACANSIEGTLLKQGKFDGSCIRIELRIQTDALEITVRDCGDDFTSAFQKARALHEFTDRTRKRGYGLQIIKTFMDRVHYRYDPEKGNELRFIKFITNRRTPSR
ncbi:MAG: ATP-binding protein [bacterium]